MNITASVSLIISRCLERAQPACPDCVIITLYPHVILYHSLAGSGSSLCLQHFMIRPLTPGVY